MLLQPLLPGFSAPCCTCSCKQRGARLLASAKKQTPKRRVPRGSGSRRQQQPGREQQDFYADDEDDEQPGTSGRLIQAPSPGSRKAPAGDAGPAYPVFAPKTPNVKDVGKWSWADGDEPGGLGAPSDPPVPEWNPQTGFMSTRASQAPSAAAASKPPAASGAGTPSSSAPQAPQASPQPPQAVRAEQAAQLGSLAPADADAQPLPAVPKSKILTACAGTSLTMAVFALFLRAYALANAPAVLGTDERALAELVAIPGGLGSWANAGVLAGTAAGVSAARFALLRVWPEFRQATERSNRQVLGPLSWLDIAGVAVLTGVSEELLFRGAIIPGSFLDWRGVLLSGVIFGVLHNSGGRNAAFAAWATGVGCVYGAAFLATKNIWVPAVAHAAANFVSAAAWKARNSPEERG